MNVAIVNDLEIEIEVLRRLLNTLTNFNIIWTAKTGAEAVLKCKNLPPDLILMNLIMPIMDGVEATKQIMSDSPVPILIITSSINQYQSKIFEALGYGALDVSSAPRIDNMGHIYDDNDLLKKIEMITKIAGKSFKKINKSRFFSDKLVVIGSSTGGPKVLSSILGKLPPTIDGTIIIVQHLDKQFSQGMTDWLGNYTKVPVSIAKSGKAIEKGIIYIASGDEHLSITPDSKFYSSKEPIHYHYVPSVDIFFESVAMNIKYPGLGIILTGMGNDGSFGLFKLKEKGWRTIAQDEQSSVVFGMPKAAIEAGAVNEILNSEKISDSITKYLNLR